jgi:hypothetical protein
VAVRAVLATKLPTLTYDDNARWAGLGGCFGCLDERAHTTQRIGCCPFTVNLHLVANPGKGGPWHVSGPMFTPAWQLPVDCQQLALIQTT